VPAHLAGDRRHGVGQEVDPAVRFEPVDGVEQADGARLLEIVDRLPAPGEPARDVLHDRQVTGDQLVAQGRPVRVVRGQRRELGEQRGEMGVVGVAGRVRHGATIQEPTAAGEPRGNLPAVTAAKTRPLVGS
jgi:hypothetical protein